MTPKNFVNNRFVDAFLKMVLFSALVHIFILINKMLCCGDIAVMNYFDILDLEFYFPGIAQGYVSHILSALTIVSIFLIMFFFATKKESKQDRE